MGSIVEQAKWRYGPVLAGTVVIRHPILTQHFAHARRAHAHTHTHTQPDLSVCLPACSHDLIPFRIRERGRGSSSEAQRRRQLANLVKSKYDQGGSGGGAA